ncbi:hypothetical protein ACFVIM_15885 [Streptomyces sp. NPDC057638]|uniref:hypothetical protein n=1 Tax=Streptomyces sp. NPDC057638 TaxID=3346190 RepID=UPI0036BD033C
MNGATAPGQDEPLLTPGTYSDVISSGERRSYRVRLDATSNAYVSAVLVPPPGAATAPGDGVRVALRDSGGFTCSSRNSITLGSGAPGPVADYSTRRIERGRQCQRAGEYQYTVEWLGSTRRTTAIDWRVELRYMVEPGLRGDAPVPSATPSLPEHDPEHLRGTPKATRGGTGFNDAPALGRGLWRDALAPGETRFYRVPLEWGQQLFLDAESGAARVPDGTRLTLFNTARGFVEDVRADGTDRSAGLRLGTVPTAFANRSLQQDDHTAMRFSGWYYVRLSLGPEAGRPLPVTLRVDIEGKPVKGPAYDGDPVAAGFGLSDEERLAVPRGGGEGVGGSGGRGTLLTVVGYSGVGLGTVLTLGLAVWTLSSRRRTGRHAS